VKEEQAAEAPLSAFLLRSLARGGCAGGDRAAVAPACGGCGRAAEGLCARSPPPRRACAAAPAAVTAAPAAFRTPSSRRQREPLCEAPSTNVQATGLKKPVQRRRSQRSTGCRRFVAIRLDTDKQTPGEEVPGAGSEFALALADSLASRVSDACRTRIRVVTRFHARAAPAISVHDYIARIAKHFRCSDECFVLASVYLDRVAKQNPAFAVNKLSVHRLLLTSVVVAAKFFDDMFFTNAFYARVGGVSPGDLNEMEGQFLGLVQWRLHVLPEEYAQCCKRVLLVSRHERSGSGGQRGGSGTPRPDVIGEAGERAAPAA